MAGIAPVPSWTLICSFLLCVLGNVTIGFEEAVFVLDAGMVWIL